MIDPRKRTWLLSEDAETSASAAVEWRQTLFAAFAHSVIKPPLDEAQFPGLTTERVLPGD